MLLLLEATVRGYHYCVMTSSAGQLWCSHVFRPMQDVTVCEAYLAFLHSGNMDDYWRTLWDNGRITREAITSKWDRKIPGEWSQLLQMSIDW